MDKEACIKERGIRMHTLDYDFMRYEKKKLMPKFQYYFRKTQSCQNKVLRAIYKVLFIF